jgi:CheY-like chemotaxis protein
MNMNGRSNRSRLHLLLVEDNPGDVLLLEETLKQSPWPLDLAVARDGSEALRYLHQEGEFAESPRPDLVLLDLNMPGTDGRQVLASVRSDTRLNGIPIAVFTSSPSDEDVLLAFNFHAEGYLRKPVRIDDFKNLIETLSLAH